MLANEINDFSSASISQSKSFLDLSMISCLLSKKSCLLLLWKTQRLVRGRSEARPIVRPIFKRPKRSEADRQANLLTSLEKKAYTDLSHYYQSAKIIQSKSFLLIFENSETGKLKDLSLRGRSEARPIVRPIY